MFTGCDVSTMACSLGTLRAVTVVWPRVGLACNSSSSSVCSMGVCRKATAPGPRTHMELVEVSVSVSQELLLWIVCGGICFFVALVVALAIGHLSDENCQYLP